MLQALPYHYKVRDYFRGQEKTWQFFASAKAKDEQLAKYKTELLKNTYKFDPETETGLYAKVETAKEKLDLQNLQVTVYQAQYTDEINASIIFINNEAHIVFSGRMIQLLDEKELLSVIAHELSHIKLFTIQNGELEIADRLVTAIANNYHSEPAYYETARLFRLYTEIFCDRGAYKVLGERAPIITSLVKTATGLEKVNADSYIKQAEEIFSAENTTVTNSYLSHPENFIRARALHLWAGGEAQDAENEIIKMIEGVTDIDKLDIFKQQDMSATTRKFISLFLKPNWFRSTLVSSQSKHYFTDFIAGDNSLLDPAFAEQIGKSHSSVKDYLGYVMLDFVMADPALENVPFGWAYQFAEDLQLKDTFDAIVKKELKLSDKKLKQHKEKALADYYAVKEGDNEQIYEG